MDIQLTPVSSAPALPSVYLELVATNAETTHLDVMTELDGEKRRTLQEQVLTLLAQGAAQTPERFGSWEVGAGVVNCRLRL